MADRLVQNLSAGSGALQASLDSAPDLIALAADREASAKGIAPRKDGTIAEIEAGAQTLIQRARARGWNVAADNLQFFLDNRSADATRQLDFNWLRGFEQVREAERVNLQRFENQLTEAANALKPGESVTVRDYWDRLVRANGKGNELSLASGDSTLRSHGSFVVSKDADGNVSIQGAVTHNWYDHYDWNVGVNAVADVPGAGLINDSNGQRLMQAGRAMSYFMESVWTQAPVYKDGQFQWRTSRQFD